MNFVCEDVGVAAAVLIRALEPTQGIDVDADPARRRGRPGALLRPGKLCQALGITGSTTAFGSTSRRSSSEPHRVRRGRPRPSVGITKAVDEPWRYTLAGSRFLSRGLRPR